MKHTAFVALALQLLLAGAHAQAPPEDAERGWEATIGLMHQSSEQLDFAGDAQVRSDNDIGVLGQFGFRFNSKFELLFGFDSATVDYDLTRRSATSPGVTQQLSGEYQIFTPHLRANYNFSAGRFVPYATAGVGWSFIETDIPTGNVFLGCWWDPWYGYFCTPVAETATTDAFAYQLGVRARWMFNGSYGLRAEMQRRWVDLSRARGAPHFDIASVAFVARY